MVQFRRTLLACVLHALLVLLSPVYLPRVLRRCGAICGFDDDYLFSLAEYRSPYLLCSCHPFSVGRLLDVGLVSR